MQRLQFAAAELEVVGGIAEREGDAALMEQLCSLADRIRDCINGVSNGSGSDPLLRHRDLGR